MLAPPAPRSVPGSAGDCPWCGDSLDGQANRLAGRIRCSGCGVAITFPRPTADELDAAYGAWYRPPSGRFFGPGDAILRRLRRCLARRLDRIAPGGDVLDVGAGDGALLDALAARGRPALGLEREAVRPDVRTATLSDLDGGWGAIVLWHSLEHLADPGAELERAAALLAPGGVLVVAVPNSESLQARVFGDRWLALDIPRHIVHLPAGALVERLRALGLEVERVSHWRGGQVAFGWLHGLVGFLPGRPDLYDAIRRPAAQSRRTGAHPRGPVLLAAALLAPVAALAAAAEVAAGRGGSIYVEARRG